MPIFWDQFDWQSFATLATGLSAVGAAYFVGRRQAGISSKQNEILERQTALSELTLRHELFDRRYKIYSAALNFLGQIIRHADVPDHEIRNGFIVAMNESKMLFRPEVNAALEEIWDRAGNFFVLTAEMNASFRRYGHYGEGNPEKQQVLLVKISEDQRGLIDLFGPDMRLGEIGGV